MANEFIELNLIPTGDKPVFHAAQYDVGRPIIIHLKNGEDDFTPTDLNLELQVRKVDNNIVTAVPDSVLGNVVTFLTTQQMTACSGTNLCEVQLSDNDHTIATLHFFLVVQRDVLNGGISSASEIHDLTEQIAEIVPEVIGDDYYNKSEVDDLIAEHTFDPTNYYDKSEVDDLIAEHTFDPTNYYDKSETDALLDDKANVSDLPDMTDYYTKSEVDTKITDLTQIKTVSGSLIHITDGGDNIPMKSLVSEIVAVESGSGEKSPTNPYTISGFNSGVVKVNRHSTVVGSATSLYVDASGVVTSGGVAYNDIIARVKQGETYTYSVNGTASTIPVIAYFTDYPIVGSVSYNNSRIVTTNATFTAPIDGFAFIRGTTDHDEVNQMVAIGTNTDYEQGNTYTFTFGQTVYGGHFDNKGNLVVTHGYIASYNGETINEPWVSSMDNYVPNTSPSTGAQVVYPLTTPNTLAITSQDIPTLSGENNIFSNCGDLDIEYFTENSDGIAELIRAFI